MVLGMEIAVSRDDEIRNSCKLRGYLFLVRKLAIPALYVVRCRDDGSKVEDFYTPTWQSDENELGEGPETRRSRRTVKCVIFRLGEQGGLTLYR